MKKFCNCLKLISVFFIFISIVAVCLLMASANITEVLASTLSVKNNKTLTSKFNVYDEVVVGNSEEENENLVNEENKEGINDEHKEVKIEENEPLEIEKISEVNVAKVIRQNEA